MSEHLGGPFVYSTGGGLACYLKLGATEDGNR